MKVSGNPDVFKEAAVKHSSVKKPAGRTKRATGGKVIGLMAGDGVRPRLDRPGRKRSGVQIVVQKDARAYCSGGRSASKIGSGTSIAAVMQTRSRKVEMPSGLSLPLALHVLTMLTVAPQSIDTVARGLVVVA